MQHLEAERIAAFDHEAPTAGELAHLEACATCRTERAAFSALSRRALLLIDAPVPSTTPRLTSWESLSARMRTEGLIVADAHANASNAEWAVERNIAPADDHVIPLQSRRAHVAAQGRNEWWRMAAAAVLLVAGGAVWGRFSETASSIGPRSTQLPVISSDVIGSGLGIGNTGFSSMEEATKALAKIERDFNRTSLWMTANDPSANASDVLRRRLAQLDQLVAVSSAASNAAPQDRVLEHYFRSAYAARELTIQQLGKTLGVGRSLERF